MPVKVIDYMSTSTLASSTTIEFKDNRRLRQKPTAQFIPPMKSFYSDKEAFDILFADEKSKRIYQEESRRLDKELLVGIRSGKINSIDDLKGKPVVSTSGTTNIKQLTEANAARNLNVNIIPAKDHAEAFLMVETDRAVAFVMDDILLASLVAGSKEPE